MAKRKTTTHSEQVRDRRATPRKRSSVQAASPAEQKKMPPVLMRGDFAVDRPKDKRKVKSPKRRYDIALSTPGVEIRLPAIPSITLGWRLASFILAGALAFLLYHLWTAPLYQVQFAELQGNTYLSSEVINQRLNLYNRPIFEINPQQLEKDLQTAFPGLLKDVRVQVALPSSVIVSVEERQPVIAWEQDGKTLWVDADGISFDPAAENEDLIYISASAPPPAPPVSLDDLENTENSEAAVNPLEEILAPEALMTPEMVAAIISLKDFVPEGEPLIYDAQHGLGFHHSNRDWDVYFGMDVSNIQEKLNVYQAIKAELKQKGISPALISVEHVHAPYYRLEP